MTSLVRALLIASKRRDVCRAAPCSMPRQIKRYSSNAIARPRTPALPVGTGVRAAPRAGRLQPPYRADGRGAVCRVPAVNADGIHCAYNPDAVFAVSASHPERRCTVKKTLRFGQCRVSIHRYISGMGVTSNLRAAFNVHREHRWLMQTIRRWQGRR